jgi:hypothetical protein
MTELSDLPRSTLATIAGQAIGALGILIQWLAAPEIFPGFPPGIVWVLGAGAIVWFDRRTTWSPLAAVVLGLWIVIGGYLGGDLRDNLESSNGGLVAGNIVMIVGLLLSAVFGVLAIRHNRQVRTEPAIKPLSKDNPRRMAVIVTIAGLATDAVADGAPEGLNWDGPGPVLFLILAAIVAVTPGRFMIMIAVLLSMGFVVGALTNPEPIDRLSNPGDFIPFGFMVLQITGLLVAIVAGIVAVWPNKRIPAETR